METLVVTSSTTNPTSKATPKNGGKAKEKTATPKKQSATSPDQIKNQKEVVKVEKPLVEQFSKISGKAKVKRLQHAQILAEKFEKMANRYDDLTQFIAGNDAENSTMKFASESGYSFTLSNPATISKVLDLVEIEFNKYLEDAEKQLINYNIQ